MKLYRYRAFNTDQILCYNRVTQKIGFMEKWKEEAFEGIVYPSSPSYFNDPYDCAPSFESKALMSIITRDTYIHLLERKFKLSLEEREAILHSSCVEDTFREIAENHHCRLIEPLSQFFEEVVTEEKDRIINRFKIVCMTEIYDSMLMWSHYAKNHSGYCIEYSFEENDILYRSIAPVIYLKDRYIIKDSDIKKDDGVWACKMVLSKSDVWSYEKEWRLIDMSFAKFLDLSKNRTAFYLGSKISEEHKKEIVQFGKTNAIPVYQMALSSKSYELKSQKIV